MTNKSGIIPTGYCVLVKQHESPRKLGKSALIIAPDQYKDRADGAVTRGEIVAMSPLAFNYAEWPKNKPPAAVGDVIQFKRYSWAHVEGADGKDYWLIEDKSIQAILDRDVWQFVEAADVAA